MNQEKESDLKNLLILFGICLAIAIIGGAIGLAIKGSYSDGNQYIGKWKSSLETITITERPNKEVRETHELADGKTAKLIMPIRVRSGSSLHIMIKEGLYDVNGNDVVIAFCDVCRIYVIFAVKREGANLLIGVPEKWITYTPVEQSQ
jgi:hypothetical protein